MEIDLAKKMILEECTIQEIKSETKLSCAIIRQLKKEIKKEMDIIRDLYMEGYSVNRIARKTGIKVDKINYYIYRQTKLHKTVTRTMGRPPADPEKPKKAMEVFQQFPVEKIERIIKLTNFCYTPHEISEDQGIETAKVRQIIMQAQQMGRIKKII